MNYQAFSETKFVVFSCYGTDADAVARANKLLGHPAIQVDACEYVDGYTNVVKTIKVQLYTSRIL